MDSIDLAYSKYCTERFALPTEQQIANLETKIEVRFDPYFRRYLLEYNGGEFSNPRIRTPDETVPLEYLRFMNAVDAPKEIRTLGRERDLVLFDDNDPPQVLPIGRTEKNSLILLITHPEGYGKIVLKVAFGGFFFLADNVDEFFESLEKET